MKNTLFRDVTSSKLAAIYQTLEGTFGLQLQITKWRAVR
jgi:hypothetical protein